MNQLPYPKPIEFHVSYSPDFNGLWFWLLAPMKGPELSVLGWQGGLDRQLPELFSALGTARLLRRLGLWIGPGVHPFRGYCLLSLPAHSSSGSGNFSVTIRSPSASGSHKSCPTSSFSWHARQAASLLSVFPSLYPSALGLGWWDLAFRLLLAVKFFWLFHCLPSPGIFISCVCIVPFLSLTSLISLCVGCSWSAKQLGKMKPTIKDEELL